ncbi:MAG: hypothetical protein HY678_00825 [Chloroflexi bacterium]|nr:hypothetical protein [Chloroflexota bacterium]
MVVHDSPPISDAERAQRVADASRRLLGDEAEPRDDVHGHTREAEPTSPADISPTVATTPGNSRTMKCTVCHTAFKGDSFGAVSAMVRRHRKAAHAQQPKDAIPGTGGEAAPSATPAVEEPGTDGDEGSPVASRLGELLGRELGPKFKNRVRSVVSYAEKHAPSVFRSSAHLRSFLMRFGIPRDVIEICVLDQFPDEVDLLIGTAGTADYRQAAASGDPAVAGLQAEVRQLTQLIAGSNHDDDPSDKLIELTERAVKAESDAQRERDLNALRMQMADLRATISAPRSAGGGDPEDRRFDRLERIALRGEDRLSRLLMPLVTPTLLQMGLSPEQIKHYLQGDDSDAPRGVTPEGQAWLRSAADIAERGEEIPAYRPAGNPTPANRAPASPAPTPMPPVAPLGFPPPPWAFFLQPAARREPVSDPHPPQPSPAELCTCEALRLPKESWGFVERHSVLCRWRKVIAPPDQIETTVI